MYYNKPNGFGSAHRGRAFNRNRHRPQNPHRGRLFGRDVNIFIKKAKNIELEDSIPQKNFSDFNLTSQLIKNIENKGYTGTTPIQSLAIEPILKGQDLIGIANTGTGKTAAFLIPIINTICQDRSKKALIITPTRELAVQINDEFRQFSQNMQIYSTLVIGGASTSRQIFDLRRNPSLVVGTPGRIKDLIQKRALNLNNFSIFVLDEVDLMVDIGFIADVKYFINLLPKIRQSLFFSATIPPKVSDLLKSFVKNAVTVSVKIKDTPDYIDQDVVRVINRDKKLDQLHDLLITDGFDKVLIFGKTKHGIEKLYKELEFRGFRVGSIHGNKTQGQRQRMLQSFKQDQIQILLATDLASRGLDIPNVSHVINYDLPLTFDDYIHRIGRTGRANKKGVALTFID